MPDSFRTWARFLPLSPKPAMMTWLVEVPARLRSDLPSPLLPAEPSGAPFGQGRRGLDEQGRRQDGQDGAGDEGLEDVALQESVGPADPGQDERELSDLGQGQAGQDADPRSVAEQSDRQDDDGRFEHDDRGDEAEDGREESRDGPDVEEHAHRDEEKAVEHVLEGQDVGNDLMAVFGLGQ